MARLIVAPIVEGHGEVPAVPLLLRRIWYELLQGQYIEVLNPIRQPRNRLATNKDDALVKAVGLAAGKLRASATGDPQLILILLDADKDPPCQLGPQLLRQATAAQSDVDVACVIANVEYESWFVAAANSLAQYLELPADHPIPIDPEGKRCGKGWIKWRFRGTYSEPVDQPKLTAAMDLAVCRRRSTSFDKLCREMEAAFDRARLV